jgi:hypothetical protein
VKVFISWSGAQSNYVASALRGWLLDVLPAVEPFMSEHDISLGERWSPEIARRLDESGFGLVIVTPQNYQAPWLNFEAGAISKALNGDTGTVVPIFYGIRPSDIRSPLTQFQYMEWSRDRLSDLVKRLNALLESPRPEDRVLRAFELYWPELESTLAIRDTEFNDSSRPLEPEPNKRDQRELLEEALDLLRNLTRLASTGPVQAANLGTARANASAYDVPPSLAATSSHQAVVRRNLSEQKLMQAQHELHAAISAAYPNRQFEIRRALHSPRVEVVLPADPNPALSNLVDELADRLGLDVWIEVAPRADQT